MADSDYDLFSGITANDFQRVTAASDFSTGVPATSEELSALLDTLDNRNTSPAIPPSAMASAAASPSGQAARGPSTSMAEANAFIRANRGQQRDENGNQVAALFQPKNAADAVNANTDKYGVQATYDESGNLSLTNIGVQAGTPVYPTGPNGAGPGTGAIAPNTPLAVNSLFNKLKGATNVDDARGILYSLREASSIQATQFETQAQQYAENQFGVPLLQKQLQEAQAADLSDPLYKPGMGDSPYTRQIRTAMEDAKIKAMNTSKVYLNNNPSYAVLKTTLANAETEVARLTKNQDRSDQIEDRLQLEAQFKKNQKNEALADDYAGLDDTQKQRLIMLNPGLQKVDTNELPTEAMRFAKSRSKDKAFVEALGVPEPELPKLALSGNPYATALVLSKEETAGIDPTMTQQKLNNMRATIADPAKFEQLSNAYFGTSKAGMEAKKKFTATVNEKDNTPEGKAQKQAMKFDIAFAAERQATTDRFASKAATWTAEGPFAPQFTDAVEQTRKVTGKTAMLDVANQFVGGASGPERIAKYRAFADIMEANAAKTTNSMFGSPNSKALKARLEQQAAQSMFQEFGMKAAAAVAPKLMAGGGTNGRGGGSIFDVLWNQYQNPDSIVHQAIHGSPVNLNKTGN